MKSRLCRMIEQAIQRDVLGVGGSVGGSEV